MRRGSAPRTLAIEREGRIPRKPFPCRIRSDAIQPSPQLPATQVAFARFCCFLSEMNAQLQPLQQTIGEYFRGKPEIVELLLTAVLARGHILIEDVPGVGKTTLAYRPREGAAPTGFAHSVHQRFAPFRYSGSLRLRGSGEWFSIPSRAHFRRHRPGR